MPAQSDSDVKTSDDPDELNEGVADADVRAGASKHSFSDFDDVEMVGVRMKLFSSLGGGPE
eukprot:1795337-Rhodomonas_salina.1